MRILSCIVDQHDHAFVAMAALLCCLGSFVTIRLFCHARLSSGRSRAAWIFLGAVAGGSTIWCTHFVAMLAYRPATPISYDPGMTALSLLLAIVAAGTSLACGALSGRAAPLVGGTLFGVGIAAMHYTGMAAFAADGLMLWDGSHVTISVALAILPTIGAFAKAASDQSPRARFMAAGLLVTAIVLLHFTGMAALTILPTAGGVGQSTSDDAMSVLAIAVAGVGLLVLGTGATSYLLDSETRDAALARLRHLADSTVDGVVIELDGRIMEVNAAFATLAGHAQQAIIGTRFTSYVADAGEARGTLVRADLRTSEGALLPVEVTARQEQVRAGEAGAVVYAVRDLRPRLDQERRIAYLAGNDSLTDLPNRASFLEKLDRGVSGLSPGESLALLAIDLDRFKEVNDLHGHAAGDEVLKVISGRMRDALEPGEFVARLAGDEFVVLKAVLNRGAALRLAERLEQPLFAPVSLGHTDVVCGGSIGIALYPQDAESTTALLANADLAMYRAKASLTEFACFYENTMDEVVRARRRTMKELREALDREEFELHYQLQASVGTGAISGYEALIRWRHPERGFVPPAEFVPLAEETGLILPIGEWVLREACHAAAAWTTPYKVAVNLSAVQLGSTDLPRLVHQVLLETGLPPSRLELEITETAMITDPERTTHLLRQIKALGVSVAMDDFGTGYSSLSTLRAFPFDKIKLDGSFMSELDSSSGARAIVRAVLALGESLQIPVLAEGVETQDQLDFLRDSGCDHVQGYLLGRPASAIQTRPFEVDVRAARSAL